MPRPLDAPALRSRVGVGLIDTTMLPFCSLLDVASELRWDTREGNMGNKSCDTGLDNRCRDNNGEIRHKRSDTLVGTLRSTYGSDFAKGYRSDAQLGTVLKQENASTLSELLKRNG